MVEGARFEIECGSDVTVGSNPTPSATLWSADGLPPLCGSRGLPRAVGFHRPRFHRPRFHRPRFHRAGLLVKVPWLAAR